MTARDEFRDPWGWLVAAVTGGIGWAALAAPLGPVAIPVGLGIGAAVLGTKVALGSRSGRQAVTTTRRRAALPKPPRSSPQAGLLARAERAQERIRTLSESGDQELTAQIGGVDDEVGVAVNERLADLAGRVTVADTSLTTARPDLLQDEYARAAAASANETDPVLKQERAKTVAALASQIEAVDRLAKLRQRLLTQMETAVVSLEGLGSRMGELVALGSDPVAHDRSAEVLDQLTSDLDTMRHGLAEAEALSREL